MTCRECKSVSFYQRDVDGWDTHLIRLQAQALASHDRSEHTSWDSSRSGLPLPLRIQREASGTTSLYRWISSSSDAAVDRLGAWYALARPLTTRQDRERVLSVRAWLWGCWSIIFVSANYLKSWYALSLADAAFQDKKSDPHQDFFQLPFLSCWVILNVSCLTMIHCNKINRSYFSSHVIGEAKPANSRVAWGWKLKDLFNAEFHIPFECASSTSERM